MRPPSLRFLCVLVLGTFAPLADAAEDYEQAPIDYSASTPADAITRLEARLASGALTLAGDDRTVLSTLLRELGVPVASQVLVFSKTSFQRSRITPTHPRALYFSDTAYIGWVPGGLIEFTAIDPQLGPIFYAFDPRAKPTPRPTPRFVRDEDCLRCHGGNFVRGIPGVFVRSVFPDATGEPLFRHGSKIVDHRTPFEDRWGGWYVTGAHGTAHHRGNLLAREDGDTLVFPAEKGANVTDLSPYFDPAPYLAPTSDIVALLVLEHQMSVQNALTQAAFDARRMLHYQEGLQKAFKEPLTTEPAYDSVKSVFASATRSVVDALLLKDEAPLPAGLAGSADFVRAYEATGPRTADGRSLRQLSLAGHLFQHRCSPLIYSDMFRSLPAPLKRQICTALDRALAAESPDARYAYLSIAERTTLRTLLRETHPDFGAPATAGSN
jgi:hypothetical protein